MIKIVKKCLEKVRKCQNSRFGAECFSVLSLKVIDWKWVKRTLECYQKPNHFQYFIAQHKYFNKNVKLVFFISKVTIITLCKTGESYYYYGYLITVTRLVEYGHLCSDYFVSWARKKKILVRRSVLNTNEIRLQTNKFKVQDSQCDQIGSVYVKKNARFSYDQIWRQLSWPSPMHTGSVLIYIVQKVQKLRMKILHTVPCSTLLYMLGTI